MNFSNRFVNNMLGPKGPSVGGYRKPYRACGKNMVKYNYYEYDNLETGSKGIEYAGSKVAVKRILEDKGLKFDPNSVVQLTYQQVSERLPVNKMERVRKEAKSKYWNTGEQKKDKEGNMR